MPRSCFVKSPQLAFWQPAWSPYCKQTSLEPLSNPSHSHSGHTCVISACHLPSKQLLCVGWYVLVIHAALCAIQALATYHVYLIIVPCVPCQMYHAYRTSVPCVPYQRTMRTVPAYHAYRTSVPCVPYQRTMRTVPTYHAYVPPMLHHIKKAIRPTSNLANIYQACKSQVQPMSPNVAPRHER